MNNLIYVTGDNTKNYTGISLNEMKLDNTSLIDMFYENRKNLFDICGNIINKDKYPFISILSTYLKDVVSSIDTEIQTTTRNSMVNWREKKNPKLLSKFINNDDNINLINRSMNKITDSNYLTIAKEISEALLQDNFRKLPEYSKFLFDSVIKKCVNDENMVKDYLNFLVGFEVTIYKNIKDYVETFITEAFGLLDKSSALSEFTYFSYVKDVTQYMNIGIILGNIALIKNKGKNKNSSNALSNTFIFIETMFYNKIIKCLNNINNFLDWMPSNMDELNGRIYLVFGIIQIMNNEFFTLMNNTDKELLKNILNLIYNVNNIPNKIKFKVLDIQDMIKKYETSDISNNTTNNIKPICSPLIIKPIVNKPIDNNINTKYESKSKYESEYKQIISEPIVSEKSEPISPSINTTYIAPAIPAYSNSKIIRQISGKSLVNKSLSQIISNDDKPVVDKPLVENPIVVEKPIVVENIDKLETSNQNIKKHYKHKGNNSINKQSNSNSNSNDTNPNPNPKINNNQQNYKNRNKDNNNISNTTDNKCDDDGFIKIERKKPTNTSNQNTNTNTNTNTNGSGNKKYYNKNKV